MPAVIKDIHARQILDSRGNPTVEVDLTLDDGTMGRASVPSGASTGNHEALELRDHDPDKFDGMGVLGAVENVNTTIKDNIIDQSFDQSTLDNHLIELDGTENKSRLGANSILGVSLAFAHAVAKSQEIPLYRYFADLNNNSIFTLPVPMINILNGGRHAQNSADIQEFMIVPKTAPNFSTAIEECTEIFHALQKTLENKKLSTGVGDEGGFAPSLKSNEEAVNLIMEAITQVGLQPGQDIFLALDIAASELFVKEDYFLKIEDRHLSSPELCALYEDWLKKYPIISIEDPFAEDDWESWIDFTKKQGTEIQIVGDDLFTTNIHRLQEGVEKGAGNCILLKPNQIGTITETIAAFNLAQKNNYSTIISHRSGETDDTTIADLAVGLGAGQIKTGSVSREERIAKYNRLLEIEEGLGNKAVYAGPAPFKNLRR